VISVAAFHEWGLGLLTHVFLQGLLIYYRLELHHLTQGRHIVAFITLCEAFLGILPHFGLWKHFFHVRIEAGPLPLMGG
jgi:hypothetical protein